MLRHLCGSGGKPMTYQICVSCRRTTFYMETYRPTGYGYDTISEGKVTQVVTRAARLINENLQCLFQGVH